MVLQGRKNREVEQTIYHEGIGKGSKGFGDIDLQIFPRQGSKTTYLRVQADLYLYQASDFNKHWPLDPINIRGTRLWKNDASSKGATLGTPPFQIDLPPGTRYTHTKPSDITKLESLLGSVPPSIGAEVTIADGKPIVLPKKK